MSIYIRGMEMPKDYSVVVKTFPDGRVGAIPYAQWFKVELIEDTKAVPVPPHGDLIDRNEFVNEECNHCDGACEALPCNCLTCRDECRCDMILDLMDAPVILPAEEGKT